MNFRSLHLTTANVIGITLFGVLASVLTSHWWSCADSSEDVLKLWIYGSTFFCCGFLGSIIGRHYGKEKHLNYYIELLLRGMVVYVIVTTALLKAEGFFYSYTLFIRETKLDDLESQTFANSFYGFSPVFQSYIGYAILAGLVLICFRRTQRIGNIVLAAILANAVMLNVSFESCFVLKNSIYLSVFCYFIFNDLPAYFSFFTKKSMLDSDSYRPFEGNKHLEYSSSIFKAILLIGLFFYTHDFIKDIKSYRSKNVDNPIIGVWDIKNVEYLESDVPEERKKELAKIESIILDNGRFGAVEVSDSLSFFEYLVIPEDNHLEIWNFKDFYNMDLNGTYTKISKDSLIYIGKNNKDSLIISFKKGK